jgi:uncharacterized protein YoxC
MDGAVNLSVALQAAIFLASVAIIALVCCLIPIAFQVRRALREMLTSLEHLKVDLNSLVLDSRELVRNANSLVARTNDQMNDVTQVVRTVRQWTTRANRLATDVGTVIEAPVFSLVRTINLLRVGATAGLRALLSRAPQNHARNPTSEEDRHV